MNPVKNFMEVVNRNSDTGAFMLDGLPFYIRAHTQNGSLFVSDTLAHDTNTTHFSKLFHIFIDWAGMEMDIRVVGKGKGHAPPFSTIGFAEFRREHMKSYTSFAEFLYNTLLNQTDKIK